MSRPFFYCSDLARASAERSFGTASVGEVWLLVEYRGAWGARALEDSALPAAVKRHLGDFCKTVPRARLLLIKRERVRPEPLSCFVVRCRERAPSIERFELSGYEELLKLDLAALGAGGGALVGGGGGAAALAAARREAPLYLVCTHGKRDKCCAKFGYALYKSLRAGEAEGGGGERVWQSSHVGGDRFAANLVCFPHGLFYAHVSEEAGRRIITEYEGRRLALEGYRGRACYSYPVQAAEFFIRTEANLGALDALRYRRHERTGERSWRVTFVEEGGRMHEAHVAARASEFRNHITCQSNEERRVIQYALEDYRATGGDSSGGGDAPVE